MKLLLFGKNGQVGWELQRALAPLGAVTALGRDEADFSRPETLGAIVARFAPDVIVNAAAYTAVDKAEEDRELAIRVNADAVSALARAASDGDALLVHYSTDYVFDGMAKAPYPEDAPTGPLGVYGRSKRLGEEAVAASGCRHVILRTSWVYGAHGRNFLKRVLELAAEREELTIVADQRGAPTSAKLIAEVTAMMLGRGVDGASGGLYHLTAAGDTTWFDYAVHIVRRGWACGMKLRCPPEAIIPITTEEFGARAPRPRYSVLDTSRLSARLGLTLPDWRVGVDHVIGELAERG